MTTYRIISDIKIQHDIEANSEEEALEIHANQIELPKEYINNSWELDEVFPLCGNCSRPAIASLGDRHRCKRCIDL